MPRFWGKRRDWCAGEAERTQVVGVWWAGAARLKGSQGGKGQTIGACSQGEEGMGCIFCLFLFGCVEIGCGMKDLCCVMWNLPLQHMDSLVGTRGLSWLVACGIWVPGSGVKPSSPASQGGLLITGPSRGSPVAYILQHQETMGRFEGCSGQIHSSQSLFLWNTKWLEGWGGAERMKGGYCRWVGKKWCDLPESARFREWSPAPTPSRWALGPSFFILTTMFTLLHSSAIAFLFVFYKAVRTSLVV